MKIAIQGHPTRGKEVIQIFENLGGINTWNYLGNNPDYWYKLYENSIVCSSTKIGNYKYYTLEEFEKEFPFKIGDVVLPKGTNNPHEIVALEWFVNRLCYKLDNGFHYISKSLTTYKEMKEERNITLTLDKAKEWYKKGGDLKQVALQAFTEKELTKVELPKTWEEFCKNYPIERGQFYITSLSEIQESTCYRNRCSIADKNVCSSQKSAEAYLAMIQLEQLRNCWWNGWKPEWNNCEKYVIKWDKDDLIVFTARNIRAFLVFPTREMAEEFLKCFKDLIEQAEDLI